MFGSAELWLILLNAKSLLKLYSNSHCILNSIKSLFASAKIFLNSALFCFLYCNICLVVI